MMTNIEFLANWMRARFGNTDRGASLVEYALLLALIAVLCIAALRFIGDGANSSLNSTGSALDTTP